MSEIISEGKYKARATGGEFGESAQKKTPFVRVNFEVEEGDERGAMVTWTGYFSENTQTRTLEALRACGCTFPNDDIDNLAGLGAAIVQIVVEHEEYEKEGEVRTVARVAWVNSLGGKVRDAEKMTDATKASLRSKMKGALIAAGSAAARSAPNGGAARSAPVGGSSADDDMDIPFASSMWTGRASS